MGKNLQFCWRIGNDAGEKWAILRENQERLGKDFQFYGRNENNSEEDISDLTGESRTIKQAVWILLEDRERFGTRNFWSYKRIENNWVKNSICTKNSSLREISKPTGEFKTIGKQVLILREDWRIRKSFKFYGKIKNDSEKKFFDPTGEL